MKTYLIIISLISIVLLINLGGCIDESIDDSVKFTIVSLKAEPSIINKGEKIILSWEVIKAQTVTINNGIGSLNNEGERTIYPHESTIYQLTAKNETKILTATVEITVIENINDSEDIDQDINITPVITITKDESFNNLRIVQVDSGVKWENINITATDGSTIYNYINNNNYIMVGDTLFFDGKGLSGSITIRFWYIPIDKLIATYTLNGVIP
ncbi:MAG: hypothetical protein V3S79_03025 [Candidatus Thermoplasmatota archaeon]